MSRSLSHDDSSNPHPVSAGVVACSIDSAQVVLSEFAIPGEFVGVESLERGHIHNTFISTWQSGGVRRRYLHQQMNDVVFADIPALMHNVEKVTRHLASEDSDTMTLSLVPTRAGAPFLSCGVGHWRTYDFIENTTSYDLCERPEQAFQAAREFGEFQARLIDVNVNELHETLKDFFSSPFRLRQFDEALACDVRERACLCATEIGFVDQRRSMVSVIEDHLAAGDFPRRVVHGDTKLNNVLFDRATGKAVCIVDLDTCMPGYSLYDFGDLVRFTAAKTSEDETDLRKVGMDLTLYKALVDGYLEGARSFLTQKEIELMPFAARLVTLTIGLRFLADYLAGDLYFKTSRPEHNLDRARVQFAMVASMEQQDRAMRVG